MEQHDHANGMSTQTLTIRDLPAHERPRERLRLSGAGQLSNPELIAILLRTGITGQNVMQLSARLLSEFDGLAGLARASFTELCALDGVSEAKACQVLAALELGRRAAGPAPADRPAIRDPEDVYHLLRAQMAHLEQEQLRVLLLNTKHEVLLIREVYQGTVCAALGARRGSAAARHPRELPERHRGPQPSVRRPHPEPGRHLRHPSHPRKRGAAGHRAVGPRRDRGARLREHEAARAGVRRPRRLVTLTIRGWDHAVRRSRV